MGEGQRGVEFENVFNFRDLGGYPTEDGATVHGGAVYRADDLPGSPRRTTNGFAALGIRTVVDLRRPNEIERYGRVADLDGIAYHHLHLVHPKWERGGYDPRPSAPVPGRPVPGDGRDGVGRDSATRCA